MGGLCAATPRAFRQKLAVTAGLSVAHGTAKMVSKEKENVRFHHAVEGLRLEVPVALTQ